jgi:ATP-dependent RNA helicase DeaD
MTPNTINEDQNLEINTPETDLELETETPVVPTGPSFADLNLSPVVLKGLERMGYTAPSPIQAATIPTLMTNQDIIGQAQTGTGKTAAFAIPIIEKIDMENKEIQAVVICPTRELALQVAENCKKISQFKQGIGVVSVYGGQDMMVQKAALRRRPQILVATPGRLLDFLMRGIVKLQAVKTVVLDEADEMLNMGFVEDIDMILGCMNANDRQTVFFSATMPKPILELTKKYQKDPQIIKVAPSNVETTQITQTYVNVKSKQKTLALTKLIEQKEIKLGLVFCNTKRQVDFLSEHLRQEGIRAEGLHGGKAQNQRERILGRFRKGFTNILIATDVAARGIDVKDIEVVINFDLPEDNDNYTHRIGRTGRAGKTGEAISLVASNQAGQFFQLQRSQKNQIQPMQIEGIEHVEYGMNAPSQERSGGGSYRGRRTGPGGGGRSPNSGNPAARRSFGNRDQRPSGGGSGAPRSSSSGSAQSRPARPAGAASASSSSGSPSRPQRSGGAYAGGASRPASAERREGGKPSGEFQSASGEPKKKYSDYKKPGSGGFKKSFKSGSGKPSAGGPSSGGGGPKKSGGFKKPFGAGPAKKQSERTLQTVH